MNLLNCIENGQHQEEMEQLKIRIEKELLK